MKRAAVFVVFLALVAGAAACGSEKKAADLNDALTSASPGATASAGAQASASPGAKATAAAPGSTAAAPGQGATASTPKPASEGGQNPPKDGTYTYTLDGTASDPTNPNAPPRAYKGTLTKKYSHSGNVYTEEQTTDQSAGRTTQRTRWESTRILLLYVKVETPQGDFSCEFNPPLVIAHLPVRPETIPTQQFKGNGNACNGTLDVQIVRKETSKDATGKAWSAWRVHIKTTTKAGQFTTTGDDTRWIAPEIGVEVRSDGSSNTKIGTGPTGGQFKATAKTALKSYPH